jgi:zinc transporter 9
MLAEAVHSLIDTANQALLALGLRQSMLRPDASHQFGYGKAAFVWSLMSALGMFWVGGGVSIAHGLHTMTSEAHALDLGWENWAVLGVSFLVDGTVLRMTLKELAARAREQFPEQYNSGGLVAKARAVYRHMRHSSDPFLTAVALEDLSACAGVIIATGGIGLSQLYGIAAFDSGASVAIGGMLAAVSVALVRLNMKYLLGQSVDRATTDNISEIIRSFPSIDAVRYVHTQWLGPTTFLLSAKVDFDGTFLSASLHREYEDLFTATPNLQDDLPLILSFYAEDVTRLVEKELQDIEAAVRAKYPGAVLIQLEPDSQDSHTHIVKHMAEASRARDEEAEVHMHHMLVLQHLKRSRPGDPRIEVQERRITQWYQRRLEAAKSKAAHTGHPLPPTPAAHPSAAHPAAPTL